MGPSLRMRSASARASGVMPNLPLAMLDRLGTLAGPAVGSTRSRRFFAVAIR